MNDQFYFQNFYEQNLYREALDNDKFPIYRGLKLTEDDTIRRGNIRHIRTFFNVKFDFFEKKNTKIFLIILIKNLAMSEHLKRWFIKNK